MTEHTRGEDGVVLRVQAQPNVERAVTEVSVVDFRMSFHSMVWFMIKWTFASIPALAFLAFISVFIVIFIKALA